MIKLQARKNTARKDTIFKTPVHFGEIKKWKCFFWSTVLLMCCLELMCGNLDTLVCAYSATTILINTHCLYIVISLLLNIFLIRSTMTKTEDDQNGRRPKWKTTKMEDDQNERRPKW